jgi:hypothetical protein
MAELEPQQPEPEPTEPLRLFFGPYRSPLDRAWDRFEVERAAFERECERAEQREDRQYLFRLLMARIGRADPPRHWFPGF